MKPVVKYGTIAAGVVVALLLAAAVVLYSVVDTDFIKNEAVKAAKEHTGRDLVFKGDVGISVFPWLGVELGPVALSNAPGFGDAPMAEIRRTDVKVKVLPLFSGNVQVSSVQVDGLRLNLGRDAKGVTNFDDIAARMGKGGGDAPAEPAEPVAPDGDGGGGAPITGLDVGGIALTDAALVWDDRMQNARYSVSELDVTTGALRLGRPFDLAVSARAEASEPALAADVDLTTRADLGTDFKTPALTGLKLTIGAESGLIPGGEAEAVIGGDIRIDLNTSTITVERLALSALGLDAQGDVTVRSFDTTPVVETTMDLAEFNPKALLRRLDLPPVETTDPDALTRAKASFTARATPSSASLSALELTVDDTTLTGKAGVVNFERPAVTFDLASTALDADRYLPPSGGKKADSGASAPEKSQDGGGEGEAAPGGLPKEQLRKLDVDGTLRLEKLKVYDIRLSDTEVTVKAKDGVIRIAPLATGLYGGLLKTGLLADVSGKSTSTKLDLGLKGMSLGGLLTDAVGEDKVTGTTALSAALAAVGDDWKSMLRTLTGNAALSLTDGVFKGFQVIPEPVRKQAAAKAPGEDLEKVQKQQKFQDISATFDVKNGLVSTRDTALKAAGLSGKGAGTVDLVKQAVDYKAVVDITAVPTIPFHVTGPLTDPSVSLDTAEFVKGLAKGVVNLPVKIGKGVLDSGKGAMEGIGSGLKNLFGGDKKTEE